MPKKSSHPITDHARALLDKAPPPETPAPTPPTAPPHITRAAKTLLKKTKRVT